MYQSPGSQESVHQTPQTTPDQTLDQCLSITRVSGLKSKFLSPPKTCWIRISTSEAQKPALLTGFPGDCHTPKSKKHHPKSIKLHTYPHAYIIMVAKILIEHLLCARKYFHVLTQFTLTTTLEGGMLSCPLRGDLPRFIQPLVGSQGSNPSPVTSKPARNQHTLSSALDCAYTDHTHTGPPPFQNR